MLDAPRAGSAEAKFPYITYEAVEGDAPRAGSAEAKCVAMRTYRATLDAPRAGSAEAKQSDLDRRHVRGDAPRAGSAEAKRQRKFTYHDSTRCTPCRQRRGKAYSPWPRRLRRAMHPVQAAPRQRYRIRLLASGHLMHPVQAAPRQSPPVRRSTGTGRDAPRAGSAEAKNGHPPQNTKTGDAPRAGSAEAKFEQGLTKMTIGSMHPVQAAPRQRIRWAVSASSTARCTPCRQRRGKGGSRYPQRREYTMHPVQAAPRQSNMAL